MSNIWERCYISTFIDLDLQNIAGCFFGNANVLNSSYTKWDKFYCNRDADQHGNHNVREVLQLWAVVLENGKAVTLAVLLIYMVGALCHPISTKNLKSAGI
jgi:hypothetical protein